MVPAAAQGLVGDQRRDRALSRRPSAVVVGGQDHCFPGTDRARRSSSTPPTGSWPACVPATRALMDMHELQITPEGTALFSCYPRVVAADLSPVRGPGEGFASWSRSSRSWTCATDASCSGVAQPRPHPAGRLLQAAGRPVGLRAPVLDPRRPDALDVRPSYRPVQLDRRTGQVMWRLGGRPAARDFAMGPRAAFSWQHERRAPPRIADSSLFDDGSDGPQRTARIARTVDVDAAGANRPASPPAQGDPPSAAATMASAYGALSFTDRLPGMDAAVLAPSDFHLPEPRRARACMP